jgi:hypothetical protein
MTRFEWDSLRKGTVVYVEDPDSTSGPTLQGSVVFVTVTKGRSNQVGILVGSNPAKVVWPTWSAVHLEAPAAV